MKSYPAALSLTGLICMIGALQGTVLTLAAEWGNAEIWSIGWDTKLLAAVYAVRNTMMHMHFCTLQMIFIINVD